MLLILLQPRFAIHIRNKASILFHRQQNCSHLSSHSVSRESFIYAEPLNRKANHSEFKNPPSSRRTSRKCILSLILTESSGPLKLAMPIFQCNPSQVAIMFLYQLLQY